MIFKTLEYLRNYLATSIRSLPAEMSGNILLYNIATASDADTDPGDALLLSLVNVAEEFTIKNYPAARIENAAGQITYANPPLFLNLYLLLSAKFTDYGTALRVLSEVVSIFQSKHHFTVANTGIELTEEEAAFSDQEQQRFRVDLELHSLTFEQLNHLWGTLGGKQYPSALYKVRVITLERTAINGRGQAIQQIDIKGNAS